MGGVERVYLILSYLFFVYKFATIITYQTIYNGKYYEENS